jgi:hypothetical protein
VEIPVLEISQASVNEPRRAAGGAAGEVVLLDECDAKTPERRVARDAAAGDPAADHEHVEPLAPQRFELLLALYPGLWIGGPARQIILAAGMIGRLSSLGIAAPPFGAAIPKRHEFPRDTSVDRKRVAAPSSYA